ncbi:hypothetical protein EDB81DRAFT_951500 [Dactylonectria macrodidyma]|uniref:BZIP domain-containing protein n=1 Tax=Dactylonectria macrodidyma TaxID=307937 RepID=A0A9P9IP24_9HYPO|nr:hypothetical protein EDB81DRAFT_951500 [Dactylonectria macrodidyma]
MPELQTGDTPAGCSTSSSDGAGKTPKRVVTAARKEQNRVAQKAYRQRQRERRQALRVNVHECDKRKLPMLRPQAETGPDRCRFPDIPRVNNTAHAPYRIAPTATGQCDSQGQTTSAAKSSNLLGPEPMNQCTEVQVRSKDVLSSLLEPLTDSNCSTSSSSLSLCVSQLLPGSTQHTSSTVNDDDAWMAHVTPLTPGALLLPNNVQSEASPMPPFLNMRAMSLVPTTIAAAIFENALSLGYDLNRLAECRGDYISPFYQPLASPDNDPETLISTSIARVATGSRSRTIPVHLRPTLAQVLIAHDASLDLIPLPFLRERAILMSTLMPDTFNLWELKFDIYHRGGLMLWQPDRSGQGNSWACSSYQPWDMRSWEAMPWFLQKWCMVIGGKESPFWKQSTWWHRMRGVEHG